jgi:putative glycosyltransferase (TIGR04372 family)
MRNNRNDVSLVQHCDFYIGSQTGPIDLACLFEKRVLTVNALSLSHCMWYRKGALFIPKKAILDGRRLSLKDQIDLQLFEICGTGNMNPHVRYEQNTADEILSVLREFLLSPELTEDQVGFNEHLRRAIFDYFRSTAIWNSAEADVSQKMRWISRFHTVKGSIAAGYLEKHWQ